MNAECLGTVKMPHEVSEEERNAAQLANQNEAHQWLASNLVTPDTPPLTTGPGTTMDA